MAYGGAAMVAGIDLLHAGRQGHRHRDRARPDRQDVAWPANRRIERLHARLHLLRLGARLHLQRLASPAATKPPRPRGSDCLQGERRSRGPTGVTLNRLWRSPRRLATVELLAPP